MNENLIVYTNYITFVSTKFCEPVTNVIIQFDVQYENFDKKNIYIKHQLVEKLKEEIFRLNTKLNETI